MQQSGASANGWRAVLALLGPAFFLIATLMPLIGTAAKRRVRCAGREFTGVMDDCFNDYLPILEAILPLLGLIFVYMFARFSCTMWAPHAEPDRASWRLASANPADAFFPALHIVAGLGAIWATYWATTYMFAAQLWPYTAYWLAFAAWFVATVVVAWPRRQDED